MPSVAGPYSNSYPMKSWWALACTVALVCTVESAQAQTVVVDDPDTLVYLEVPWLTSAEDSAWYRAETFDDSGWASVDLPRHSHPLAEPWVGHRWYRLHFQVRPEVLGHDYELSLGPVRYTSEVFLNGSRLGARGHFPAHPTGSSWVRDFRLSVPKGLLHVGENTLAVHVYDPSGGGGINHGPLLLGTTRRMQERFERAWFDPLTVRLAVGLFAILLGLVSGFWTIWRARRSELRWLSVGYLGLGLAFIEGTGLLFGTGLPLPLVVRVPFLGALFAIYAFGSTFLERYGEAHRGWVPVVRGVFATAFLVLLFGPDAWVASSTGAILAVLGLVCALYCLRAAIEAYRQEDETAIPILSGTGLTVIAILVDALTARLGSPFPWWSLWAFFGTALVASVTNLLHEIDTHEKEKNELLGLRHHAEWHRSWRGALDACSIAITNPDLFVQEIVREGARTLEVRRCSMMFNKPEQGLTMRASFGLPSSAASVVLPPGEGIAGWVYENNRVLTSENIPEELKSRQRRKGYATMDFVSAPIEWDGEVRGVLNVADREDGMSFSSHDRMLVSEFAGRIGLVFNATKPN